MSCVSSYDLSSRCATGVAQLVGTDTAEIADPQRALDTAAFEAVCEARWWPPLRSMYPLRRRRRDGDAELVRCIHAPELTPESVLARWPSHLHIDIQPEGRGLGFGPTLIETVVASLRAAGGRGVHLGVDLANARAIGFYEHLGWRRLHADDGTLLMGRRWAR